MEKTTVDFISVASSIYHCFFISRSISDDVRCWSYLILGSLLQLPGISYLWLSPLIVNLATLHSSVSLKPHKVGQNHSWVGGIVSPPAAAVQRGVLCLSRMAAAIWVMTQYRGPATLSVLSPKLPSPVSPQASPCQSALAFAGTPEREE